MSALRILLFPVLLWFSIWPYAQLLDLLSRIWVPTHGTSVWFVLFARALLAAALVALAAGPALALLFGRAAVAVAALLALPTVALLVSQAPSTSKPLATAALMYIPASLYLAFVVGSTAIARARFKRHNPFFKRIDSSAAQVNR